MARNVKVHLKDKEEAENLMRKFCVCATQTKETEDGLLEYEITGFNGFVCSFLENAVSKNGFIKLNVFPRFV